MSDHSCRDWFDGREPGVWRTLKLSEPAAPAAARIREAFIRHGWTATPLPPDSNQPGWILDFTREFPAWSAHVEVGVNTRSNTVALFGVETRVQLLQGERGALTRRAEPELQQFRLVSWVRDDVPDPPIRRPRAEAAREGCRSG